MNICKKAVCLVGVLGFLSLAVPLQGQNKPNVSGTWKMNPAKTKFEQGGPAGITIKFDQQGSTLNETLMITSDRGERSVNFSYTLDGKESQQQMEGRQITTAAKWEGASLVIEFKNEQGFTFVRKFTMSGDAKTMTLDVKQSNPNGTTNDMVFLEKQ